MRKLFLLSILLVGPLSVSPQVSKRMIVWDPRPACGFKQSIDAAKESVSCSAIETESGPVSVIEHSDVVFSIVLGFDKSNIVVSVSISNSGGVPLEFDSDNWAAAHYRSEDHALNSKRPIFAEYSIPSREMAGTIRSGVARMISLESFMSDLGTVPTAAEQTTPIKRNPEEPDIQVNQNEAVKQLADQRIAAIRKTALTAKYVAAGSKTKGLVYFRREKKAPYSIISMPIGDTVYVIHFLHKASEH